MFLTLLLIGSKDGSKLQILAKKLTLTKNS